MKNSLVVFSVASVLVTSLTVFVFKTGIVAALTATSTSATSTDADPIIALFDSASSTPFSTGSNAATEAPASTTAISTAGVAVTDSATSTPSASSATSSISQGHGASSVKSKPALKRVHVVGSKYVDFFTDGTTIFSFPGDPSIDANLNKPNASIPTHAGLTWVSSKGMEAYDTASGDLEPGAYAQESDGSFISNAADAIDGTTSPLPLRILQTRPLHRPRVLPLFRSYFSASRDLGDIRARCHIRGRHVVRSVGVHRNGDLHRIQRRGILNRIKCARRFCRFNHFPARHHTGRNDYSDGGRLDQNGDGHRPCVDATLK